MTDEPLKLLLLYHRAANEYRLMSHNQIPDEARKFISEWDEQLALGTTPIALDETRRHATNDVQKCRLCTLTARHSSHLEPQPRFQRREP
jgi:hypothetical protein